MNELILDYSNYISEKYEYDLNGFISQLQKIEYKIPENYLEFFKKRGTCPFCKTQSKEVFHSDRSNTMAYEFYESRKIWMCLDCGWWESFYEFSEEKDLIEERDGKFWETQHYAILKKFEINDKNLPVKVLLKELERNKNVLYQIHPYKLEELVQSVFSAYYECDVLHVGKSHDGGVDLILVNSDNPILVQVKRRGAPNSVESVSTVRDFLGAMFIKNNQRGIILSTAKSFSKDSGKVIDNIMNENRLAHFELINFSRFCEILDLVNKGNTEPWRFLANKV